MAVSGPESALEPWRQEAGDDVDFLPAATAKQCARACRAAIDDHFLIWGQMGVGYENSHQEFSKVMTPCFFFFLILTDIQNVMLKFLYFVCGMLCMVV